MANARKSYACWAGRTLLSGILVTLLTMLVGAGRCSGGTIRNDFGPAGPSNWATLVGPGTTDFALNGPGATDGNVGYDGSSSAQPNASGGREAINGSLYLGDSAAVNDTTQLTATVYTDESTFLNQAWTDAANASTDFDELVANMTLSGIDGSTTIDATASTFVVDVNGNLDLGSGTLTINGAPGTDVIINITGGMQLNSGQIVETGGIGADNVLLNFVDGTTFRTPGQGPFTALASPAP